MHRFIPILILLAACAETPPAPEDARLSPEAAPVDLAFCEGEQFTDSIGQPVSSILGLLPERARVLGPDELATQDYRIDRLNVFINDAGIIQRLTCG
ncbi:Peptidase inhibitor I78 family protein [Ruegeria denitrificans]|uniref:Peptidase inhibitor I78 family protein n=1 Tax=Ruegeria denitrificans TaxID=1715692 RepID=A0A0N7MA73_9RHOB|nr:I78 family peptidase inhibitor [Ruegeria denitrificans]CUK08171.1 Peptidase inhibitor I78 family protein [Ruegeria denitrificans]